MRVFFALALSFFTVQSYSQLSTISIDSLYSYVGRNIECKFFCTNYDTLCIARGVSYGSVQCFLDKKNKLNKIEFIDIFGGDRFLKLDDLKEFSGTLLSLRLYGCKSKIRCSKTIAFPKLLIFDGLSTRFDRIPSFLSKSLKLRTVSLILNKLERAEHLPKSLENINFFVERKMIRELPIELFVLPNLKTLSITGKVHKNLILPKMDTKSSSIEFLDLPIDLSKKQSISFIEKFKKLETLYVKKFTGNDFLLLKKLSFIKNIYISDIEIKKEKELMKLYENIR